MPPAQSQSAVITGCGWVTPFAAGTIAEVLTAACDFRGRPLPDEAFWFVPDRLRDDFPAFSAELKRDKGSWMTAAAFEHACRDASLDLEVLPAERVGMVLGCALAGQLGMIDFAGEVREQSARFVSPIHFPQTVGNYIAGALARAYGVCGPNSTVACGLASGLDALAEASALVAAGKADVVLAGGTERLSTELAQGLAGPNTTVSEGACLFVVESAGHAEGREAAVLARIAGTGHQDEVDPQAAAAETGLIRSCAGAAEAGAIMIEHGIGQCFGALGAAAAAAAIGAGLGLPVPVCEGDGSISIRPVVLAADHAAADAIPASVSADAGAAGLITLDLAVTRPR